MNDAPAISDPLLSAAQSQALARAMEPGEEPLWAGAPERGGLNPWGLLAGLAGLCGLLVFAGDGIWRHVTLWLDPPPGWPDRGLGDAAWRFLHSEGPPIAVIAGAVLAYLLLARAWVRRFMARVRYMVTDRAAYIVTGDDARRIAVGADSPVRIIKRIRGWQDVALNRPAPRHGANGPRFPEPDSFRRLTPASAEAARDALRQAMAADTTGAEILRKMSAAKGGIA